MSASFQEFSLANRLLLAEKIRGWKALVADEVETELSQRPPDCQDLRGLKRGQQDTADHLEHLAGAIASGSVEAFEDYSRWSSRVSATQSVGQDFLHESFRQLEASLKTKVEPSEGVLIGRLIEAGCRAADLPEDSPPQNMRERHRLSNAHVKFLGTNLPQSGIVDIVREFQPDLLGIAATMIFNLDKVANLVAAVQAISDIRPPVIILGGAAFRHAPNLYAEIGAHGQPSDLRSLLELVDSLLPAP